MQRTQRTQLAHSHQGVLTRLDGERGVSFGLRCSSEGGVVCGTDQRVEARRAHREEDGRVVGSGCAGAAARRGASGASCSRAELHSSRGGRAHRMRVNGAAARVANAVSGAVAEPQTARLVPRCAVVLRVARSSLAAACASRTTPHAASASANGELEMLEDGTRVLATRFAPWRVTSAGATAGPIIQWPTSTRSPAPQMAAALQMRAVARPTGASARDTPRGLVSSFLGAPVSAKDDRLGTRPRASLWLQRNARCAVR